LLVVICYMVGGVQARGEAGGGEAEQGAHATGGQPTQQYQLDPCRTVSPHHRDHTFITYRE
jgi:hypothetical protein